MQSKAWLMVFVILNDIAIAILVLKAKGYKKILYFDMDAHYGDGIIEYFKKTKKFVQFQSIKKIYGLKQELILMTLHNTYNFPVPEGFNDSNFKK